jgi:hypothetical protein
MTLFYSHHDRSNGSDGGFSARRVLRRIRTALKKLHRAIAAAKIRRLRNELRLHAATRANRARPDRPGQKRMATGFRANRCISARNGISDMQQSVSISALLLRALTRLLILLGNEPVRIYRPEAHYMRGPGPAWRAKHGEG